MLATWGCTTFPKPTLSLDFLGATSLDSGITFSRGSQATLFDSTGTLVYAKHNLLLQSQDFATTWSRTNGDVTANAATAPDGTLTADKFIPNTTAGVHYPSQSVTTNTVIHTASVYLKAGEYSWAILYVAGAGVGYYFDIANGAVGNAFIAAPTSFSIQSVGDGWRRYSITFTATASTTVRIYAATANGTNSFSGDGTSGIFIWGAQLNQNPMEGGVTSSLTTYYPTTTAAYYAPRFDYDPSTLQPRGLLIEEQRTNSILQSENFAITWGVSGSTISTDTSVSPAGTTTADSIVEDATTSAHRVAQTVAADSTLTYTATVFIKSSGRTWATILLDDNSGNGCRGFYNLSTGVVGTLSTSGTASGGVQSITAVGNGWYRCGITCKPSTVSSGNVRVLVAGTTGDSVGSYAGTNGLTSVFVWGAQLEAGAFATSYIPTTTTALTRNADVASMTGTNFSSWYSASEGTLLAQATGPLANVFKVLMEGATVSDFKDFTLAFDGLRGNFTNRLVTGNYDVVSPTNSLTAGATVKLAGSYTLTSADMAYNGLLATTKNAATQRISADRMFIGSRLGTSLNVNGHIQRISFWPTRLPNATLQALTA